MATKNPPSKSTRKLTTSKTQPQFVVMENGDPHSPPFYWTDGGYGYTKELSEATRYSKEGGIRKLGELLHEDGVVCELVDVSVPYVSPVKIGTVVLRDGVTEMVNSVPLVRGGTLLLISPGDPREIRIQDFLDEIDDGDLAVLWDPERSVVPKSGLDYLQGNGFIDDVGNVRE